jgi:glutamate synthase domain-containing protein 2
MSVGVVVLLVIVALVLLLALYDVTQKKHAIRRNFPIIGNFRYMLEMIGPELRQYIVTSNDEERPFSRDQRSWVYASSKKQNNYFGFGTDNDLEQLPGHIIVKHNTFPHPDPHKGDAAYDELYRIPVAKVLGGWRKRAKAFRPESVVSLSAMSFGSLSEAAVEAINRGCDMSHTLHNTGEGGISPHHGLGAGLIYQLGTGYFGARDHEGRFNMDMLKERVARYNVRAIEIKLSQGAKPGRGGVLPAAKITPEIAEIRGIPMGKDCLSPSSHREFSNADELLDFVERIADATGLPVGIKSAVGDLGFWHELAELMARGDRAVDYIAIDGGEGGTGAAPLVFSDHVALPFKIGFSRVYAIMAEHGLTDRIVFIGSGKLGFPQQALFAFAMGCDMVAVAREAMLSIGCIQAQRCQTGHCPTGVATQNKWLVRGLDPTDKSARLANYVMTLRKELMWLCYAAGVPHPSHITFDNFELLTDGFQAINPRDTFHYKPGWGRPSEADREEITRIMGELGSWKG